MEFESDFVSCLSAAPLAYLRSVDLSGGLQYSKFMEVSIAVSFKIVHV